MIRPPAAAGSYYAMGTDELRTQIENAFKSELGAGLPDTKAKKGPQILAAVSPHAGIPYSGPAASHLFKIIAESKQAKTYVILGPSHTGMGSPLSTMASGAWATPLGQVPIDGELANKIISETTLVQDDEMGHFNEHSIEVQLPFLQYVQKEFKFVPICMLDQGQDLAIELGGALAKACGPDVTVIASSDFTHHEPQAVAKQKDMDAIASIEKLDVQGFYDSLHRNMTTACGYGPIAAAMTFAKEMGAKKGTLLKYSTSGDVLGDMASVVGYASILF